MRQHRPPQSRLRPPAFRIELPRRRLPADRCVHDRLRRRGLVGLVVPKPAIADEIDDDVLVELHAVVDGEARREHHRLGVVAVDVQDRRLDHLRDVAAIERGARVARVVRGEADLVVDDQVDRAARVERAGLRHLQGFLDHALAGEGRIAMDQHGHDLVAALVAAPLLARAYRAFDDRVHDLEVRRVERERDVDIARRASARRTRSPCGTSRRPSP